MPRPPRIRFAGAYYHVYNRGVDKAPIVKDDQDRKVFMELLGKSVRKFDVSLFAYCLMNNHYHLYFKTAHPNLNQIMWFLQYHYAQYFNSRYDRIGPLFQGRYKSESVETGMYSLTLVRYIHHNPLEAALVSEPENYPWSSYPCYIGKLPKWPWLNTEWLLSQFHSETPKALESFRQFHSVPGPFVPGRPGTKGPGTD